MPFDPGVCMTRPQPVPLASAGASSEVIETQGDEHHVVLSADANGDGKPDVWMTDTTGDGKADLYQFDTTGDGQIDVTIAETADQAGGERVIAGGDGGHPQTV
ncbi:hypothetical protein ACN2WE_40530 [Streptomyces sp. cg28]|uniref:hypothetical protein n=1 Tax=Streptomyces sp. cg28 TaxID=3403457 RepID=UPI003B21FF98